MRSVLNETVNLPSQRRNCEQNNCAGDNEQAEDYERDRYSTWKAMALQSDHDRVEHHCDEENDREEQQNGFECAQNERNDDQQDY